MIPNLTEAREGARNATRASLFALRSMVDERIRRVERMQATLRVHATGSPARGAAPEDPTASRGEAS